MTNPCAASGTDRVAELARKMPDIDVLVNVQGDEPEIAGTSIDLVIELLENNPDAVMSTLVTPIRHRRQLDDPACVKVVFDRSGRALQLWTVPKGEDGQEKPGELNWVHGMALDSKGNIYATDIMGQRVQKFVRRN